jgi:HEAT repeat protein
VSFLLKQMSLEEDQHKRSSLMQRIINIGSDVVMPLIFALKDSNWMVRMSAAEILGELKDKRAIPALIRVFEDKKPAVRQAAAHAFQKIRAANPDA